MAIHEKSVSCDFDYKSFPIHGSNFIRIIELQPASSFADPLLCDVIPVDRPVGSTSFIQDRKDGYEAVSYTWGAPDFSKVLECKGGSYFAITPNVDMLLRYLRKPFEARRLWIDALSINQKDECEKSYQVSIMGDIYSQADKVHVWLGEEEKDDSELFNFFHAIGDWKRKELNEATLEKLLQKSFGETSRSSIRRFFAKPWFLRRWIIQEIIRSKHAEIRCGRLKIDWPVFVKALRLLKDQLHIENTGFDTAVAICELDPETINGADLLVNFRASQCSDAKDRLFAFSGLSSHGDTLEGTTNGLYTSFKPDYTMSLKDISTRFAAAIMATEARNRSRILDLAVAFKHPPDGQNWPSWVPDWSAAPNEDVLRDGPSLCHYSKYKVISFEAFAGLELSQPDIPESKTRNHRKEILWVGESLAAQLTPSQTIETIMSWLQLPGSILSSLEKTQTTRHLSSHLLLMSYFGANIDAHRFLWDFFPLISGHSFDFDNKFPWKFLTVGYGMTNTKCFFLQSLACSASQSHQNCCWDECLLCDNGSLHWTVPKWLQACARGAFDIDQEILGFCEAVKKSTQGRAFFLCSGTMGLCPLETRVGDHILYARSDKAFVARSVDEKDLATDHPSDNASRTSRDMQTYRLIGVCDTAKNGAAATWKESYIEKVDNDLCKLLDPKGRPYREVCTTLDEFVLI